MSRPSSLRSEPAGPGRQPPGHVAPLTQYVLKLVSRCDLACDHCYVYEHPDQSWRRQPRVMAPATVQAVAQRIAEHAATHRIDVVRVVLHGGEPLLAGAARLDATAATLRRVIDPVARLDLRMQSNGVLLTPATCDVLVAHDVKVGISLDGDRAANDRHRRHANGSSSHRQVLRALSLLRSPAYRTSYAGILCTVDLANDPVRVYEALLAEEPPHVDFLLPHANWDSPPARPDGLATPYADWLLAVHRRWLDDGRPVPIRLLESLLASAVGHGSRTEAVGLGPADLVVVETDGTFEQVDSLKSAFDGAAATGLDVFRHRVDDAAAHPAIAVRQSGLAGLCATCRACPVVGHCGGGLYAHRYRAGNGFDNPSVYCPDLLRLVHVVTAAPATDEPTRPTDSLSPRVLDDLASGAGTTASAAQLAAVHLALVRALLVTLGERAGSDPVAADGWRLLVHLDDAHPDAVRAVLAHPFVRRWARRCRDGAAELSHLACVAAAAAVRARVRADLPVPVRDGMVNLPTLGALAVGYERGVVRLVTDDGDVRLAGRRVTADAGHDDASGREDGPDGWLPVRSVRLGGDRLLLEDTDPHRECYDLPVERRLSGAAALRWTRQLERAVRRIDAEAAGYAAGVRTLLRAVVPLRAEPTGRFRSAAAGAAFGAVAVTAVPDDATLAVLLVHEVQHLKLSAVLDVCDLFDRDDARTLRVPWRDDPRPVEGVLHGVYAHLAVADVWRHRPGPAAEGHFRRYRAWTDEALDALLDLDVLTAAGERFVRGMRDTVDGW
ncbi:FxsB family radical SAM/SPASM domain protein [Micromonospora sp. C31]|uniref:FxsB family cyclophane-forming radical SAM/SPASM peptide maturase n=1 Tax=Micromonospora sp. C31 TaxID=2824876 RepID=UPI001B38D7E3|nr:FxsB family cyclophane-forming radical SAM/SPASM peptide maturase [Micromonospora sp. C31]MBQ1075613.1 FxsB family radical SAM/SPASM domain protein [Micromonospora sp. C31]